MSDWRETIHQASDAVFATAQDLYTLADAFRTVGNHDVANRLSNHCERLTDASSAMDKAVTDKLHEDFTDSRNMAGSILAGIVGGAIRVPEKEAP